MSRIFISHATPDNAKTRAIIEWIVSHGWPREEIFVDFDDIGGGQRWREALTKAATRCEAVVFLISPEWVRRPWCTGEASAAQMLGKQIIPVLIEPTPPDTYRDLLTVEYQLIDLTLPGPRRTIDVLMPEIGLTQPVAFAESGLQRLVDGLKRAGLDPSTFPLAPGRKIYPGLAPLDTDDAAVFFGRDADIARGLETLRQMRERGPSLFAILAASGAGKSSFLRAGLWPRLQRADREFLMLPVLRPGVDALDGEQGLVAGLHRAGEALGLKRNRADWRVQIDGGDLAGALSMLHSAARARMLAVDAAQPAQASRRHTALPPIPVLPIDQAEELFGAQGIESARRLLDLLGTALREGQLIAVLAIRSDRYGDLQTSQALAGLEQRPFSLPPIADGVLKDVIEGPAQRDRAEHGANGLKIDPQLTDRLLRDWADADSLPLLAFTLRRLLDDYGSDGRLRLDDYERSGQLQGALEAAIARAMQDATAAGSLPEDAQAREALIRSTFVPWLVSIDPQSQQAQRRIARRDALPTASQDLIDRLIDARLLTCDRPQDSDASIEVAHEAILHHWPLLDRIIGQEREALIVLNEVKRDAEVWLASKKSDDALESDDALLHRGERLRHAEQHLAREDFQKALGNEGRRYLAACSVRRAQELEEKNTQQARETKQIAQTRKAQRMATNILAAMIAITTAAGFSLLQMQKTISQSSASVLANLAAQAFEDQKYDRAIRFSLAAAQEADNNIYTVDVSSAKSQLLRAGNRFSLSGILPNERQVKNAIYSPDGKRIATISEDHIVRIWDSTSHRNLATLKHGMAVNHSVFSPDSRRIATTSGTRLHLWDCNSGKKIKELPHDSSEAKENFSPDGRYIFTLSGSSAYLWSSESGKFIAKIPHNDRVSNAAFSPDSHYIVTTSWDDTAILWKIELSKPIAKMIHADGILNAAFSPDGLHLVTRSFGKNAYLWRTGSKSPAAKMGHITPVETAEFSSDGRHILTTAEDDSAYIWKVGSESPLAKIGHLDSLKSASLSPDAQHILTTSQADNHARIWRVKSGYQEAELPHRRRIIFSAFSPDGRFVATTAADNITRIWKTSSGEPLQEFHHEKKISSTSFSPDSSHILTASIDGSTRIWNITPKSIPNKSLEISFASKSYFSQDRRRTVIASGNNSARIIDLVSGKNLLTLPHDDWVLSASFSPSGDYVISTSSDNTARLWDSKSGKPITTVRHDDWILSADVSPDEKQIITASLDKTVRLWDARSGLQIAMIQHSDSVQHVSFNSDGKKVTTITTDGSTYTWDTTFFALSHRKLIDIICRETLYVDNSIPPREADLSRLTDEELQMAPVIDPNTERDVCRPPTRWQRLRRMFGFGS